MKLTIVGSLLAQAVCGQTIWFEPNQGQAHPSVQFLARTRLKAIPSWERNQMAVRLQAKPVRMSLESANGEAVVTRTC